MAMGGLIPYLDTRYLGRGLGAGGSTPFAPPPTPPLSGITPPARNPELGEMETDEPNVARQEGLLDRIGRSSASAGSHVASALNMDTELGRAQWSRGLLGFGQGLLSRGYGESTGQAVGRGIGLAQAGVREAGRDHRANELREFWGGRGEELAGTSQGDLYTAMSQMDPNISASILPALARSGGGMSDLEKLLMRDKMIRERSSDAEGRRNRRGDTALKQAAGHVARAEAGNPDAIEWLMKEYPDLDWSTGKLPKQLQDLKLSAERLYDPWDRDVAREAEFPISSSGPEDEPAIPDSYGEAAKEGSWYEFWKD